MNKISTLLLLLAFLLIVAFVTIKWMALEPKSLNSVTGPMGMSNQVNMVE